MPGSGKYGRSHTGRRRSAAFGPGWKDEAGMRGQGVGSGAWGPTYFSKKLASTGLFSRISSRVNPWTSCGKTSQLFVART
ncbi:MAG: hypothetical protein JWO52_2417 [Gammaproteobacteria bacterium]|nr:hypothetical protein [Gammaproteobacteria bacterium]